MSVIPGTDLRDLLQQPHKRRRTQEINELNPTSPSSRSSPVTSPLTIVLEGEVLSDEDDDYDARAALFHDPGSPLPSTSDEVRVRKHPWGKVIDENNHSNNINNNNNDNNNNNNHSAASASGNNKTEQTERQKHAGEEMQIKAVTPMSNGVVAEEDDGFEDVDDPSSQATVITDSQATVLADLGPPSSQEIYDDDDDDDKNEFSGVSGNEENTKTDLKVFSTGVLGKPLTTSDTNHDVGVSNSEGTTDGLTEMTKEELIEHARSLQEQLSELKVALFIKSQPQGKRAHTEDEETSEDGGDMKPPALPLSIKVSQSTAGIAPPPVTTLAKQNIQKNQGGSSAPRAVAKLHPALFSVRNGRSVRKAWLGRSASISTRNELNKLPIDTHEDYVTMMTNMFAALHNPRFKEYLSSHSFAHHLLTLCKRVGAILEKEPRVLEINSPAYVLGDLHGNLEDLHFFQEHVWPMGMALTAGKFLFLGDYVDRGDSGLEVLAYLFAQKVQYPDKVFLIRGNHETRAVNGWEAYYKDGSFLAQCKNRFGTELGEHVWSICNQVFDRLPLACIIDKSIFCVHGGIPRPSASLALASATAVAAANDAGAIDTDGFVMPQGEDDRLRRIRELPCPIDIQPAAGGEDDDPANALAFSLVWSDPADDSQEGSLESTGFGNSARGGGTSVFGNTAVQIFLEKNKLDYILRAHEATVSGVAVSKSAKVLTIFSTSKDHGCGGDAKCGCVLVDNRKILAINKSDHVKPSSRPPPGQCPPSLHQSARASASVSVSAAAAVAAGNQDDGTDTAEERVAVTK